MNNIQKAKYSAYQLITTEADNNSEVVALILAFDQGIKDLKEILKKIDEHQVLQKKGSKGVTSGTNQALDQLVEYLVDVSGAIQAYAHKKNDVVLFDRVNYSENSFQHMRKQDIIATSTLIIEEMNKIAANELATFGISANESAELKKLHENLKQNVQAPQQAIIDRSNHTENLAKLFEEAAAIKRNILDRLVSQFKKKAPDFYQKYISASNVIYKRTSHKNGNDGQAETPAVTEENKEK
jgi:hypothetical protein